MGGLEAGDAEGEIVVVCIGDGSGVLDFVCFADETKGGSHVGFEGFARQGRGGGCCGGVRGGRTLDAPNAVIFGHFLVPLTDIRAYEVEYAFQGWNDILRDVVFRVEIQLRILEEGLGCHAAVDQPRPRCTGDNDIRHAFPILGLQTRIFEHFPRADHGAWWREASLAVRPEADFARETEILNRHVPLHDFGALGLEIALDLAEVRGAEEGLEGLFFDFLLGRGAVSTDGFDALCVEVGVFLVAVFVFEADVAFLGEEDARVVDFFEFEIYGSGVRFCH